MEKKKLAFLMSALLTLQAWIPATAAETGEEEPLEIGSGLIQEQEVEDDISVSVIQYDDPEQPETEELQDKIVLDGAFLEESTEKLNEGTQDIPEKETEEELFLEEEMMSEAEAVIGAERDVEINAGNFPDVIFRNYIQEEFDTNRDGVLDPDEINSVDKIDVSRKWIESLKGIEQFTSLTYLDCNENQLTALDVSKNTGLEYLDCRCCHLATLNVGVNTNLKYLYCSDNQLSTLNVGVSTNLEYLNCSNNHLTTLDVSKNTGLEHLSCGNNQLTDLDVSANTGLKNLSCGLNHLMSLDVSENTGLEYLSCDSNQLTDLDVSANTGLKKLDCGFNQLTSLDVSSNTGLEILSCGSNQLATLDVSGNMRMKELRCSNNRLTILGMSGSTELELLDCSSNQLTTLDVSKNIRLKSLDCSFNQLIALDVSSNTGLKFLACHFNQLAALDVSRNTALENLYCASNQLTALDVSRLTGLEILYCGDNQLTSLDMSRNPVLEDLTCYNNQLDTLDVSGNSCLEHLKCDINHLASLDLENNPSLLSVDCNNQNIQATVMKKGNVWKCDLGKLVGSKNVGKIKIISPAGAVINKGIVMFQAGMAPDSLVYQYETGVTAYKSYIDFEDGGDISPISMTVNVSLTVSSDATPTPEPTPEPEPTPTPGSHVSETKWMSVFLPKYKYTYTGKALTPKTTVYYGSDKLKKKDYTVTYQNNINPGKATVIVEGKGEYKGISAKETFKILPKTVSLSSVQSSGKKKITVKWKKGNAITGYQVQYSTNSKFKKGNKNKTVSGISKTSVTLTGLKSKKAYYVRVRTYKTSEGKKYYSPWSKKKKVTVK